MRQEHLALKLPAHQNLRVFSRILWKQGIPHRVSEQGGELLFWVPHLQQVEQAKACYQRFQQGDLPEEEPAGSQLVPRAGYSFSGLREIPVTLFLLLGSLVGASLPWISFDWVNALSFYHVTAQGEQLQFTFPPGEYWRLLTPVFLHFGALHITFNALWVWELGRRIERFQGGFQLLGITLLIGVGSNLAQAFITREGIFGGMSGVIYGYLGYMVIWSRLRPERSFHLPTGIVIFMLAWLVLCIVGFAGLLGVGAIANAAHVGGLVMGAVLGLFAALISGRREP